MLFADDLPITAALVRRTHAALGIVQPPAVEIPRVSWRASRTRDILADLRADLRAFLERPAPWWFYVGRTPTDGIAEEGRCRPGLGSLVQSTWDQGYEVASHLALSRLYARGRRLRGGRAF